MPLSASDYATFSGLIEQTASHTERQCGAYLPHAADWLCPVTPQAVISVLQEDRTHYGDSDCTVVAEWQNGRGKVDRYAVVWEVKAPQCLLMEIDENRQRFRPTKDLIKAENQLLHYYYYEISNSDAFRERHGIISRELVKLGGIIIGRDGRIASMRPDANQEKLADMSLTIRSRLFYEKTGFHLRTWDSIASVLKP